MDKEKGIERFREHMELVEKALKSEGLSAGEHGFLVGVAHDMERGVLRMVDLGGVEGILRNIAAAQTITGNFAPILMIFRLEGHTQRIRLVTKEGKFVLLSFAPERRKDQVAILTGGRGNRELVGWLKGSMLRPAGRGLTEDVVEVIKELAADPLQCVKAYASKVGECSFCGAMLADPASKAAGYGKKCAERYGLPWGVEGLSVDDLLVEMRGEIA